MKKTSKTTKIKKILKNWWFLADFLMEFSIGGFLSKFLSKTKKEERKQKKVRLFTTNSKKHQFRNFVKNG